MVISLSCLGGHISQMRSAGRKALFCLVCLFQFLSCSGCPRCLWNCISSVLLPPCASPNSLQCPASIAKVMWERGGRNRFNLSAGKRGSGMGEETTFSETWKTHKGVCVGGCSACACTLTCDLSRSRCFIRSVWKFFFYHPRRKFFAA